MNTRLSNPLARLALVTALAVMLTSSWDLFLVVQAGGNYRFCQLASLVLIVLAMLKAVRDVNVPVLGAGALLIWLLFQLLFVPTTEFWPKSLGYCFWLIMNLLMMWSFVQLFSGNQRLLLTLLRGYAYSFGAIALFGIVQFCMPLLGLGAPLVTQWWIPGSLARANAFSYEPSYFATYLLIGWVFIGAVLRSKFLLLPRAILLILYWLALAAIVLSSSRMGLVFLVLEIISGQLRPWVAFFRDAGRLRVYPATLKALVPSFLLLCCTGAIGAATVRAFENNPALTYLFLNGTGISNTAAHSVVERESALRDTLEVFFNHPFVGRSLGGVSSAIADLHGERIQSFESLKDFEGMNVFAEMLAASGLIGAIPFVWFFAVTIRKPLKLAQIASSRDAALLRASVRSLVFGWALLQFNQNLLRPYLWVHLAVVATLYAAAAHTAAGSSRS